MPEMHNIMLSSDRPGHYKLQLDQEYFGLNWNQLVLLVHLGIYLVLRDAECPKSQS